MFKFIKACIESGNDEKAVDTLVKRVKKKPIIYLDDATNLNKVRYSEDKDTKLKAAKSIIDSTKKKKVPLSDLKKK